MSSSGTYNYRPKVEHPNKEFIQMTSDGFQPPFFFGGSQVPLAMGIDTHTNDQYVNSLHEKQKLPMSGRGIKTTAKCGGRIHLPVGKF